MNSTYLLTYIHTYVCTYCMRKDKVDRTGVSTYYVHTYTPSVLRWSEMFGFGASEASGEQEEKEEAKILII